ncbi:sigma factor-like helix-turn-helix DNA-binding protein [Actinophytocola xanthii]|uniref:RNA polymerase sigma factor 70 region 4 type 2 domain-containing protein n=1 Tax=Actinophytocola xanthii TaxID=1912961 RepID=A0A1Q8CXA7_9PSEU|nr:sigma factor-like helix-turn-helix DNA-binding protein [Actinophytocola xanthii]OLF18984.1 hypothetical protein BU204_03770 [Actinophytocola xanthii]
MVPGGGGDEETFEEFTARSVDHLTRLGYLLSGDPECLVLDCLAEVRRRWPGTDATTVLVRRFLANPAEPGFVEELAADLEDLRLALAALPPRQRAAVVLRYWAGLPVAEVATVLDGPERVVATETGQGLAGVTAAAAQLTAASQLTAGDGVEGERAAEAVLADGLRVLAEAAPPLGVGTAEILAATRPVVRSRRRWLAAVLAGVVLVGAGAVAVTLRTGSSGEAEPEGLVVVSATPTLGRPHQPPNVELPPIIVDDQARKLTRQLRAALDRVLPGATVLHPVPRPPGAGDRPPGAGDFPLPLEFHLDEYSGLDKGYLASATVDLGVGSAVIAIDVRWRSHEDMTRYTPCPEIELDCTFRQFPDRTRADVVVFTDPASRAVVHTMSSLRPDGTFVNVTVQSTEPDTPPPLSVEDLFRFARVFTY